MESKLQEIYEPYTNRLRSSWTLKSNVPTLKYEAQSRLFLLDSEYLENSGLSSDKLILYCRDTFQKQFTFLQERVIKKIRVGYIPGPTGTGKSTTTLDFASTLDRDDWVITWIHLIQRNYHACVRFVRGLKQTRTIKDKDMEDLKDIIYDTDQREIIL